MCCRFFAKEIPEVAETVTEKDEQMVIEKDALSEGTDNELDVIVKLVLKVMDGVLLKVTKDVPGELLKDTSVVPSFIAQEVPMVTGTVLPLFVNDLLSKDMKEEPCQLSSAVTDAALEGSHLVHVVVDAAEGTGSFNIPCSESCDAESLLREARLMQSGTRIDSVSCVYTQVHYIANGYSDGTLQTCTVFFVRIRI